MNAARLPRRELWLIGAILLIAVGGGLFASFFVTDAELRKTLQTATITLVFAGLLGELGKQLLDDFDRGRQQRTDRLQFYTNILADLKSVYDQTERAKILIAAHQSAKTYGDEIRGMIEARVKMVNVVRAVRVQAILQNDPKSDWEKMIGYVEKMEAYLGQLINEFQIHYKGISEKQREYEAVVKGYVDRLAKNENVSPPLNEPWLAICQLEQVLKFLNSNKDDKTSDYQIQFIDNLDAASEFVRMQMKNLLK